MNSFENISGYIAGIYEKKPYYVIGGFLAVLLIVDYFCVLQHQLKVYNSLNTDTIALKGDLEDTQSKVKRMPWYQASIKGMDQNLKEINKKIKSRNEVPLVLENISRIANDHGIRIEKIMPGSEIEELLTNEEGQFLSVPVLVEARCTYHDFGRFLNQLEVDEVFLNVSEFTISNSGKDMRSHSIKLMINTVIFEKTEQ